jgi:hypothetical protein
MCSMYADPVTSNIRIFSAGLFHEYALVLGIIIISHGDHSLQWLLNRRETIRYIYCQNIPKHLFYMPVLPWW